MEQPAASNLADARAQLERLHVVGLSNELQPDTIRDSWQRCLDAGLDPAQRPMQVDRSSQELRELIDQESFLLHLARSEFVKLKKQLPGETCLVGLANRDAVLIDVSCSNIGVRSASKAEPGSCWNERFRGTNAIGTAAHTRAPVAVVLQEHFLRQYGALTCVATTISNPDGELAGILHVSTTCPVRQRHSLSLLCLSAMHMESELFRQRYKSGIVLQFHSRDEFADTPDAGLIALDEDGRILSSNRQARFFLEGLPLQTGHHFNEIFREPFRQFMAHPQLSGEAMQLVDIKGSSSIVWAHVPGRAVKNRPTRPQALTTSDPSLHSAPFVCSDPAVAQAVSTTSRAVALSIPILIRGETGTGKEMLAQYAHRLSGRSGPFVAVNCAAVPESLIESELFGYREGAFTGARSGGSEGLVLQANGGTLFLDEIGDMPLNLQPALLRLLDNWKVRPIGSSKETKVDVQLITATHCDLEQAIAEKRFRRDLLHRINGVEILLPPVRERSDFDELVRDLLAHISPHIQIAPDALSLLRDHPWQGNIRELRNVLVRSILACDGQQLSAAELTIRKSNPHECKIRSDVSTLLDLRRAAIMDAYHSHNGNISKTAQSLRISRNTLYRELRKAGLIHGSTTEAAALRNDQESLVAH